MRPPSHRAPTARASPQTGPGRRTHRRGWSVGWPARAPPGTTVAPGAPHAASWSSRGTVVGDLVSTSETPSGTPRARLRELLAGPEPLIAPGAYDALSARLVELAGFDAVYMTGFGTSASR